MTQEHVLAEEEQMTAAQTKQHEDEKHTGIRTEKKKEGSKTNKQERKKKVVLKASTLLKKKLHLFRQSRAGDLATRSAIFFLLVHSGIKSQYCRCPAPPP